MLEPVSGQTEDAEPISLFPPPVTSQQCQLQGIVTAEQWMAHFTKLSNLHHQCGFIVSTKQKEYDPADGFYQGIRASVMERGSGLSGQNEFRIATWDTTKERGYPERFPVQSFFYIKQSDLKWAQYDQTFFYNRTHLWVPVIKLTLPASSAEDAKFEYSAADQNIPDPDVSPRVLQATGNGGRTLTRENYQHPDNLTVDVPVYTGMVAGDVVNVRWEGKHHTYEPAPKTVAAVGTLHFNIPRVEFIDAIGSTVNVSFSVRKSSGAEELSSAVLPLQVEGQPLTLPPPVTGLKLHSFTVKYAGMTSGQYVSVTLDSPAGRHQTAAKAGSASGAIVFDIPMVWLDESRGKGVSVYYTVQAGTAGDEQFSRVLRATVPKKSIADYYPKALQATGNDGQMLMEEDYYSLNNLTVDVPAYTDMATGDVVSVRWEGPHHTYAPAQKTVNAVGTLHFSIPRGEFIDAIGSTADVSFFVRKDGGTEWQRSDVLLLQVEAQPMTLPAPVAGPGLRSITVKYVGMTTNQRVSVTFDGVTSHRTDTKAGSASGVLVIDIPEAWVKENKGKKVQINYVVGDDTGSREQFSQILRRVAGGEITPGILALLLDDK